MMTYSVYHPNPGYSQGKFTLFLFNNKIKLSIGMADMLTPIVYVFMDESLSYFAYCSLMNRYMSSLFDRDQNEIHRRARLFNSLLHSIDRELWNKINSYKDDQLYIYHWLLLDCRGEFSEFNQVLRVLELVWINSIPSSVKSSSVSNYQSVFTVFLCISILQEDRKIIVSCSNEEDLNNYFFTSTVSRSYRSMKRILQRAQFYYSNYKLSHK